MTVLIWVCWLDFYFMHENTIWYVYPRILLFLIEWYICIQTTKLNQISGLYVKVILKTTVQGEWRNSYTSCCQMYYSAHVVCWSIVFVICTVYKRGNIILNSLPGSDMYFELIFQTGMVYCPFFILDKIHYRCMIWNKCL